MAKGSDSKGKTLAAAAALFRQQGYHGTALHDILAAAGSPRGSLYFHFPRGKEEIGEAALTLAAQAVAAAIAKAADTAPDPRTFLSRIVRGMADDLQRSDFRDGCPIATTALETAAQSEVLGTAARAAFEMWQQEIAHGLERFRFAPRAAAAIATAVLSQLEGALLLARTTRSIEPMRRAEKVVALLALGTMTE
jgi:TetR/AcrR family transcriptional repressor of lmrAB and yxaGH operons